MARKYAREKNIFLFIGACDDTQLKTCKVIGPNKIAQ